MQLTRRGALAPGAGAAAAVLPVRSAHAAVADAIIAFTGGAKPAEGDVPLGIPEIGENDASVPVTVAAPGACMTETATAV